MLEFYLAVVQLGRRATSLIRVGGLGLLTGLLTASGLEAPAPANESGHDPGRDAVLADAPTSAPVVSPKPSLEVQAARPEPKGAQLHGLSGAATALAVHDYARAIALAEGLAGLDAQTAVVVAALKGRALRMSGQPGQAIRALEPAWAEAQSARAFPRDALGLELAQAKLAWARSGELEPGEADAQRVAAAAILKGVERHQPLRNRAEIKVLRAQALLETRGSTPKAGVGAAKQALKHVDKVLRDYPHHPRVGELWLERARAMERSGQLRAAFEEFRTIAIRRAGEPEAELAWAEAERMAGAHTSLQMRPLSDRERLLQAQSARGLRRVELSREVLDTLVATEDLPRSIREDATDSRSYTAYKQRDYQQCAEDLAALYARKPTRDLRGRLIRCLERAGRYEDAIALWMKDAKSRRRSTKAVALWEASDLAVRGGLYEKARELLAAYTKVSKGHRQARAWLGAWLAYRLGDTAGAIAGFERAERGADRTRARYFRGKLLVRAEDPAQRKLGAELLADLCRKLPLDYYGLMARQRLVDANLEPPAAPELAALPEEERSPPRDETQGLLDDLDAQFGHAWPPIRRARQLYAAGYLEEARREVRVAVEAYATRGRRVGGVRSEAITVGLGWQSNWRNPRVAPTKAGRRTLRRRGDAEALRAGLRKLSRGMEDPYRFIRLTEFHEAPNYTTRWHPRAYRPAIEREARLRGVDPIHMWALMYTESRFRRFVVSPVGARGALQIMPWTASQLAERLGELDPSETFDDDRLFDIDTNAHLAGYYVSELLAKFHGQAPMAYASYNGGPSNVARWLDAKALAGPERIDLDAFVEEIPFRETYRYTKRVMEVAAAYQLIYRRDLPRWTNAVDPTYEGNIEF